MIVLAVDCMGGDSGVSVTLPACRQFLDVTTDVTLLLVGDPAALASFAHERASVVPASEVVGMDDPIEVALRKKKDSSMRVAIEQVRSGKAHVALSAGNTGALMAISRYLLKTMPGIDRPAIATQLPNMRGGVTTVLDLGANVDCSAEHLLQFAVMASALVSVLNNDPQPTVGLLNIGEEQIKGSEVTKRAGELLRAAAASGDINFHGNVEGNDIFKGTVDIVVCDGFVGNVLLKTIEGLAFMMSNFLKQQFKRTWFNRLAAIAALPVMKALKRQMDHRRYNGAALLGLRALVYKSHGSADVTAFRCALNHAYDAARNQLLERVQSRVEHAAHLLTPQAPYEGAAGAAGLMGAAGAGPADATGAGAMGNALASAASSLRGQENSAS